MKVNNQYIIIIIQIVITIIIIIIKIMITIIITMKLFNIIIKINIIHYHTNFKLTNHSRISRIDYYLLMKYNYNKNWANSIKNNPTLNTISKVLAYYKSTIFYKKKHSNSIYYYLSSNILDGKFLLEHTSCLKQKTNIK